MIRRDAVAALVDFASQYPVVAILGPRQSGKTTLAKATFPNHSYISLEDLDQRAFAQSDPRKFLDGNQNEYGIILDEVRACA